MEIAATTDKTLVDWFVSQTPVVTDWDAYVADIGNVDTDAIVAQLQSLEPMRPSDYRNHEVYVLQTKLRLAFRHRKGLPLYSRLTCPVCGIRKADTRERRYGNDTCLYCAERRSQLPRIGSRGSCGMLSVAREAKTGQWGVLYYVANYHRDKCVFLLWLALGFSSHDEALLSLYPLHLFSRWDHHRKLDLGGYDADDLVSLSDTMSEELPLTPAGFRAFIRSKIEEAIDADHVPGGHRISHAIHELGRSKSH